MNRMVEDMIQAYVNTIYKEKVNLDLFSLFLKILNGVLFQM